MPSPRPALGALLVSVSVSVSVGTALGALLLACGGRAQDDADSGAVDAGVVLHHLEAGADAGPADAPDEYSSQAPHCARAADAGSPVPFDAGADATPGVTALAQVTNLGGPTMKLPTFVSVTFPDDTSADELDDFVASVGCTDYWRTIGADYGVGDGVAGPPVRLAEQAPASIDDTGIRAWLTKKIDGGDPLFPRPAADTIYVLWYPDTTSITLQGITSCQAFLGYHEGGQLADGTPFSYAVVPRCGSGGGLSGTAELTVSASHELIEACTNPQPDAPQPAYALPDTNHMAWILANASEVGDLCEFDDSSYYQPSGFPWTVQRIWSNRAAWAGNDPCVPSPTPDYFYAAPVAADTMSINLTGTPQDVAAVHVAVGASATVPVLIVGSASTGAVHVQAIDAAQLTGQKSHLALALDASTGKPGDTLHLTITKNSGDPSVGAEAFVMVTSDSAGHRTLFFALTSD
ncbi:MAG TPA: hypothetical protein VIF15_06345 [Polyangiaceae bacterium]